VRGVSYTDCFGAPPGFDVFTLQVKDVSDASNPVLLGTSGGVSLPVVCGDSDSVQWSAQVIGNYVYVAALNTPLESFPNALTFLIFDIRDKTHPVARGSFYEPLHYPQYFFANPTLEIAGGYAYVIGPGFHVIDLKNPDEPVELGSYDNLEGREVEVVGNLAFVATASDGMAILDLVEFPRESPLIAAQPESLSVLEGTLAEFFVWAKGSVPLSYQWSSNGTNIPGATEALLTLSNVAPGLAQSYTV